MTDCEFKCSFYVVNYFISFIAAVAVGLLSGFGILVTPIFAVIAILVIAAVIFVLTLIFKLYICCGDGYRCRLSQCILRHLAIEAALAVLFAILALVLPTALVIVFAVILAIAVFFFVAAIISAAALVFGSCNNRQ